MYLLGWLLAGAAVAVVAVALLGGGAGSDGERHAGAGAGAADVRPVREIVLGDAMRRARCSLRRTDRTGASSHGDGGPAAVPAGVYRAPLHSAAYRGALAHGIVVIEYHSGLSRARVDDLASVQRALPAGTIVAPARERTRTVLRASAGRRVLSCAEADDSALDALALFRGRFVGSGA